MLGRTQSSVVDVHFGFTKSVDVLVMHGQLIEDLALESNLLMGSLMLLTILFALVTLFVQVEVLSLPLLKSLHFAWGKFRELLPLLTYKTTSLNTHGQMYKSCVRGTMLYSSECWALRPEDKKCLEHSESAMLLWM